MNIEVVFMLSAQYAVEKDISERTPAQFLLVGLYVLASSCVLCGFPSDVLVLLPQSKETSHILYTVGV